MNKFSGIILAGGKSTRMGTDKSLLTVNGKTFLQIQAEKLLELGASEVIISGKSSPFSYAKGVMDVIPDMGPLGGLYSCFLDSASRDALVLSVDVPLISIETLNDVLSQYFSGEHDATILSHNGHIEPLIAVYRTDRTALLKNLLDQKKLAVRAFLDRLDCQYYEFHGDEKELLNCNTIDDLKLFQA